MTPRRLRDVPLAGRLRQPRCCFARALGDDLLRSLPLFPPYAFSIYSALLPASFPLPVPLSPPHALPIVAGLSPPCADALKLRWLAVAGAPVHPGFLVPLVCPAADAAYVHGKDGFGDTGYAPATRLPDPEQAAVEIGRVRSGGHT